MRQLKDKKPAPYSSVIRDLGKKKAGFTSSDFVSKSKLSRQSAARILREWMGRGELFKEGSTKTARYFLVSNAKVKKIKLLRKLAKLDEDQVFNEVDLRLNLRRLLNENSYLVLRYAFTEMLNNAIDHSESSLANIEFCFQGDNVYFSIRDFGLGVFANIQKKFDLNDEFQALSHLLKGKQTTQPEKHSGQGIFFTSKAADVFVLKSHKIEFTRDNLADDQFVAEGRVLRGTFVSFKIAKDTRKKLGKVFDEFTGDNYEFDKSSVRIKLGVINVDFVSRSEAKRIMLGLDKFSRIELDFTDVKQVGQGFADEIFRVYQGNHKETLITATHANSAVSFMIERAKRDSV